MHFHSFDQQIFMEKFLYARGGVKYWGRVDIVPVLWRSEISKADITQQSHKQMGNYEFC